MAAQGLEMRAEEIRVRGYARLEPRLAPERVTAMRECFEELLRRKAEAEPTNRGAQRYQMFLPWEAPLADPALYEHEAVLALVEAVLGPDPALVYFASDTPLPGSEYQRVHSDTQLLFPETSLSLPPYALVLNVPLVDCTEENGSLEYWPGTHLMPGRADLERLADTLPSCRANMPAGSLLVRDPRMWHRGTPNHSRAPRPHLALVYARPWYRFEQPVPSLTRAAYEALSERGRRLLRYARIED